MIHRALLPLACDALILVGCPPPRPAAADDLATIKARGKLVVAMDVGYDPFEKRLADGTVAGFDVDIVTEVCKDLGVTPELVNTPWEGIITALSLGKVDAIFSGMSITKQRQRT